ncbi:MAG: MFS transporter [Kineosporiaceae bacterium]
MAVRQPVPVRDRLRIPGDLPGLLPARPGGHQPGRRRPPDHLGTTVQSVALVSASLVAGKISARLGRRKIIVTAAATTYAAAMFLIAAADSPSSYLAAMAVGGIGFGACMAVDLALVVDVLPDATTAAKDLGVLNIAGALPFALAPAVAPGILAVSRGSYAGLYFVAAACALVSAVAIQPVKRVS